MARLYNLHARLLVLLFLGVVLDVGVFTTRVLAAPRLHGASGGLKVRKEIREMTCKEWDRFSSSVNEFRKSGKWDEFANLHTSPDVWDVAHSDNSGLQAAFLPWHRVYLSRMESELQKIDPEVTIPYWNWALDSENPLASPVLSDVFFGSTGNPEESYCVTDGSFKDDSNKTCIQRALPLDGGGFLTLANLKEVLTESSDYGRFVNRLENGFGLHGHLHMFLGGNMANLNSPKDPLFYAHHSFMDMLWWRWQKMHNSITSPAYKGDAEAPLYPFRESASEVFSSEEMGYTYSNPLKRDPKDNTSIPCFLEKGGRKDIVALGERVWTNLPNDVKALRQIPRRAPLPETRYWSQWLSLQEEQKGAISVEEIEAQISSLTDVIAQPSISRRVWRNDDGDFGLGMPLRMILDKSEEEEEKDPDTISEDKTCSAFPDCRNCFSSIKLAEEAGCVERYPESFRENLETAVTREFRKQAGEPPTKNEGVNAGPGIQENVVEGEGEMPASDVGIGESLDSTETTVPPLPSAPANVQPPPTSPPQTPPAPGPLPEDSQKDDTSMAETDPGTVEENIDSPLEEGSQAGEGSTEEEAQATSNVETLDKVVTMTVEALDEEKPVEQRVEDVFSDKVLGQVDALFEDVSSDSDSDVDSLEEEEKKEGKGKKKKKEEEDEDEEDEEDDEEEEEDEEEKEEKEGKEGEEDEEEQEEGGNDKGEGAASFSVSVNGEALAGEKDFQDLVTSGKPKVEEGEPKDLRRGKDDKGIEEDFDDDFDDPVERGMKIIRESIEKSQEIVEESRERIASILSQSGRDEGEDDKRRREKEEEESRVNEALSSVGLDYFLPINSNAREGIFVPSKRDRGSSSSSKAKEAKGSKKEKSKSSRASSISGRLSDISSSARSSAASSIAGQRSSSSSRLSSSSLPRSPSARSSHSSASALSSKRASEKKVPGRSSKASFAGKSESVSSKLEALKSKASDAIGKASPPKVRSWKGGSSKSPTKSKSSRSSKKKKSSSSSKKKKSSSSSRLEKLRNAMRKSMKG